MAENSGSSSQDGVVTPSHVLGSWLVSRQLSGQTSWKIFRSWIWNRMHDSWVPIYPSLGTLLLITPVSSCFRDTLPQGFLLSCSRTCFFFYSDLIILENKFSFQDFFVNGGLVKIDHFSPFDSILLNLVLLLWLWLHPGLWLVAAFGFPAYCFHAYCWPLPFWRGPCLPLPFWRCPCLLLSGLLLPCLLLPFWLLPCLLLPCVLLPR